MFFTAILVTALLAPTQGLARSDEAADRAYFSATSLLRRGLHDLAIPEYERFLAERADDSRAPIARYGIAVCQFRLGHHVQALEQLRAIADQEFAFAADALNLRAHCAIAVGEFAEAEKSCRSFLSRFPEHASAADIAAMLTDSLFELHRPSADIVNAADLMLRKWPSHSAIARVQYLAGASLVAESNHKAAATRFEWVVDHPIQSDLALQSTLLLAQCLEASGEPLRAHSFFQRASESSDAAILPDALLGLARLSAAQGRAEEARSFATTIVRDHAGSAAAAPAAILLARMACESNAPTDALSALTDFADASEWPEDLADDAAFWGARIALLMNQPGKAAKALQAAIGAHPDSELLSQMEFDYAIALMRSEDAPGAAQALRQFGAKYPDLPQAREARRALAGLAANSDDLPACIALCESLLREADAQTERAAIGLMLADARYRQEQYNDAARACEDSLRADPAPELAASLRFRQGMSLLKQDEWDRARPLLESVVAGARTPPQFTEALHALGSAHFERSEWSDADRRLGEYVANHGSSALAGDALLKQGISRRRLSREVDALASFEAVIERHAQSPHYTHALFERAQSLLALNRLAEAQQGFAALADGTVDDRFTAPSLHALGSISEQSGDFQKASEYYGRAGNPGEPESGSDFARGRALFSAGKFADSINALTSAINASPSHPSASSARIQCAIALARVGRTDEAMEKMGALLSEPTNAAGDAALMRSMQYEKAWLHRSRAEPRMAREAYELVLKAGAEDAIRAHALIELGGMESDASDWTAAAPLLDEGRRLASALPDTGAELRATADYRAGICAVRLEKWEEAVARLEDFGARHTGSELSASAELFCAEAFTRTGRNTKAIDCLNRAMALGPDPSTRSAALLRLGGACAAISAWEQSETAYASWLESYAEDSLWYQARFGLGWAAENQRRWDDAISHYQQVVSSHEGELAARAQFQIGECLFAQSKHEDAIRAFVAVDTLYAYPQWSAAALFEMACCLEEMGRANDARKQFEEVRTRFAPSRWSNLAEQRLASAGESMRKDATP